MSCDLDLPAVMTERKIKVRKNDVGILLSICDSEVEQRTARDVTGYATEAKACQLTNNKLFYRHLSPLGFLQCINNSSSYNKENHNREGSLDTRSHYHRS